MAPLRKEMVMQKRMQSWTRWWTPWALGLALMAGTSAGAATGSWEAMQAGSTDRESVQTWTRQVEGMAVKQFRGVTEVHYTVLGVLALLADVRNMPTWVFQCQSASHPDALPPDHIYMRFKGVWPASDRDVLFKTVVTQDNEGRVVVDSQEVAAYPEQPGYVRMPRLHNVFRLTPLKAGWTKVEFDTLVDLGGMVPSWLANLVSTKAPIVTLNGMRQQLPGAPYQIKTSESLPRHFDNGSIKLPAWHLMPAP